VVTRPEKNLAESGNHWLRKNTRSLLSPKSIFLNSFSSQSLSLILIKNNRNYVDGQAKKSNLALHLKMSTNQNKLMGNC
jgi:hypothetical protein